MMRVMGCVLVEEREIACVSRVRVYRAYVRVRVRACVRACMRVCVRACVRVFCACVCVCVNVGNAPSDYALGIFRFKFRERGEEI